MYLNGMDCGCRNSGLSGLGFWETLIPLAASAIGGSKGGGGGGGGGGNEPSSSSSAYVSTNVTTNVSPQISPTFVQQSSPNNSPVTSGAAMGTIPSTGSMPGIDNGYMPQVYPTIQSMPDHTLYWVAGGVSLVGIAILLMKKRRG